MEFEKNIIHNIHAILIRNVDIHTILLRKVDKTGMLLLPLLPVIEITNHGPKNTGIVYQTKLRLATGPKELPHFPE